MDIDRFKPISGRLAEIWYEDKKYLAFVPKPLPPAALLNSSEIMLALSRADRALGELAGLGQSISFTPNPRLLVGPFITREAIASSHIEGIHTAIEELYALEVRQLPLFDLEASSIDLDTQEVSNYVAAFEYGIKEQKQSPIDLTLIRTLHRLLMKGVRGERARPGEFRTTQNWIGSSRIGSAKYVPPPVSELHTLLDSFEEYLQADHELPPLIRLALIHYHFEALHPFGDGNGRTGRLLISLLLLKWGLLPEPLLDLSSYFDAHTPQYYELLLAVSEQGNWEAWVTFFLEGVAEQAKDAIARSKKLQELQMTWRTLLTQKKAFSLLPFADELFSSPLIAVRDAQRIQGVRTYNAAQASIKKLVDFGILKQVDDNRYPKLFVAEDILRIVRE